jgi:hypothetical protein
MLGVPTGKKRSIYYQQGYPHALAWKVIDIMHPLGR